MKQVSNILSALSLAGVVVLFVLFFTSNKSCDKKSDTVVANNQIESKIVYVNTDSLLSDKFLLYKELSEKFLKTQESRITDLNIKAKALDQEAQEWQRKVQNNGFMSEQRALDARNKIVAKQQELQTLQQEMSDKSAMEEAELSKQVFETVTSFLREYNKGKGFSIILSTSLPGNVLYAEDGYDITNEVIEGLNKSYSKR